METSGTAALGWKSQEGSFRLGNSLQESVGGQTSATGPEQTGTEVRGQSDLDHGESSPRAVGWGGVGATGKEGRNREAVGDLWTARFWMAPCTEAKEW